MNDIVDRTPLELLLAERRFVERLARRLVGNRPLADDVSQAVWITALTSPPEQRASVRGWLARVTRNAARQILRSDRRREAREQRAFSPRALEPAAADAVAQAEIGQRLVAAVLALDEPYRGTLLLRFRDDLGPSEVAARLQVPVETVRTRIKRGLERLRARLEQEDGLGPESIALLLPPVAPPTATGPAGPRDSTTSFVPRITGGLLMTTLSKSLTAAAVLLVAAAVWWYWPANTQPNLPTTDASGTQPLVAAVDDSDATPREIARSTARRTEDAARADNVPIATEPVAVEPTSDTPDELDRPRVVNLKLTFAGADPDIAETGVLFVQKAGASLEVMTADEPPPNVNAEIPANAPTEIDVSSLFAESSPADLEVTFIHPNYLPLQVRVSVPARETDTDGQATQLIAEFRLTRVSYIEGRVVDDNAQPVSGAEVATFRLDPGREPDLVGVETSAPDGTFQVRTIPGVPHHVSAVVSDRPPAGTTVAADATDPLELVIRKGQAVSGRLHVSDARLLEHLVVSAEREVGPLGVELAGQDLTLRDGALYVARVDTKPGLDGSFTFPGLSQGSVEIRVRCNAFAAGITTGLARSLTPPAENVEFTVTAALLQLSAVNGEGEPISGVQFNVTLGDETSLTSAANGAAQLWAGTGRTYDVNVSADEFRTWRGTIEVPQDATTLEKRIVLQAGSEFGRLRVRLSGDGADQIGTLVLQKRGASNEPWDLALDEVAHRAEDGSFTFTKVPSGEQSFQLLPGATRNAGAPWMTLSKKITISAGQTEELKLPVVPAGRLRIRAIDGAGRGLMAQVTLRDAQRRVVPIRMVYRNVHQSIELRTSTFEEQTDLEPSLAPGSYTVELSADDHAPAQQTVVVKPGQTHSVELTLKRR